MGRGNISTGKIGEKFAIEFLTDNGYKVLETNVRTPLGELDIVAKLRNCMVFIEVKTRASSSLGPPILSVTNEKQRHIIKNAFCYLKQHGLVESTWRIDVVSVRLNDDHELEHIELIENAVEEYY